MQRAYEIAGDVTATESADIKAALDGCIQGACDAETFGAAMIARCKKDPDVAWELLALLDQYGRRGQLGQNDFSALKARIGREAYGGPVPRRKDSGNAEARIAPVVAPPVAPTRPETKRLPECGMVLRRRFVLEAVLGSGGMGTVYRALDRNRLDLPEADRYVAIKVLRAELATRPEAVDRLKREFHQTQKLSHPGIVNAFDFDTDAGIHFFTMELLEGELLGDILARLLPERLERSAAATILRDLGNALSHAHEHGIVHADLKPGNIMIMGCGGLRVLDFGLAMPLMREPWISNPEQPFQALTRTYASCERLAGESPDVRDDIFSYACMAYELLAGRHPFARKSALQARDERMRLRRIHDLTRRQWRALAAGLAWERADRPETVDDLVRELASGPLPHSVLPPYLLRSRKSTGIGIGHLFRAGAVGGVFMVLLVVMAGLLSGSELPSFEAVRQKLLQSGDLTVEMAQSTLARFDQWRARSGLPGVQTAVGTLEAQVPRPATLPTPAASGLDASRIPRVVPSTLANSGPAAATDTVEGRQDSNSLSPVATAQGVFSGAGRLEFAEETLAVPESEPVARLIVQRRGASNDSATFKWRTLPGSATENQDYASFGTVTETLAPGQKTATILIPIVRDPQPEGDEVFYVELTEASGQARPGAVVRATVVIEDDD